MMETRSLFMLLLVGFVLIAYIEGLLLCLFSMNIQVTLVD